SVFCRSKSAAEKHSATYSMLMPGKYLTSPGDMANLLVAPTLEVAMFFRTKKSGPRTYLQIVENHWRDGRPQQTVIGTVGRLDELQANGQVDALLTSGARFAHKLLILSEHKQGKLPVLHTRRWGAP